MKRDDGMEMDDGRKPFLDALKQDEDDVTTRLVYADWLDDHGYPEEADRQRQWNAAKAWLMEFSEKVRDDPPNQDWYEDQESYEKDLKWYKEICIDYDRLLEMGGEIIKDKSYHFNYDEAPIRFSANTAEYLQNWSIVTGEKIPDDFDPDDVRYSCSC